MKPTDRLPAVLAAAAVALTSLTGCNGLFAGVYDEPEPEPGKNTVAGQLYIDASDWGWWYYLDLPALADSVGADSLYNPSTAWVAEAIPMQEEQQPVVQDYRWGIYTYWYDVFGDGLSKNEFRSFMPTAPQPEPERWTVAVHRNNVRTNGCAVAATDWAGFDELPQDVTELASLKFEEDSWNETDVWCIQERMLLGLIGNQGIAVSNTLSQWLTVQLPPIPPALTIDPRVFIIKLPDQSYGALQLADYIGPDGTKCCLTINYRYPL